MHEVWVFCPDGSWKQHFFDTVEEVRLKVLQCVESGWDFNVRFYRI